MSIKKDFFAPLALGLGATRRAAMLLLVMMLTAATAWATSISTINVGGTDYTLFTGFTATAGTKSYANFVDGNTSTQWQVMKNWDNPNMPVNDFAGGTENPAFVEFHADAPFIPKGYILTYDNSVNENWKPTSWALKAKLNESGEWTTIHSSNSSLGNGSRFEIACNNNGNNQYQYFRFEIYDVESTMQSILNELQIYAQFTYTPVSARAATCTEYGLTNDGYLRSDGKYYSDENGTNELTVGNGLIDKIPHDGVHHEASDSNIEYWQCSMCGKYFTDEACTHEVTADEVFKGIFGTLTAGTNGESGYYTLESQTYTLTEDVNTAGYIYVPEGVTATIDLAGHTIDRGLTSTVANGYVIKVAGTLTLTDSGTGGTVKGGMDSGFDHVSCVKVAGSAAFILQGGTLIGNTSYKYNNAVMGGNNTSITISGGKITGDARGIYSLGNITVSGGEISGNTIGIESLNYSISVSGNPVITNNTNANVTLDSSLTIAGELTVGANIGITKRGSIPTDNAPVTITSGYGTYNNSVSPDTYFSLDNNGQIQTSPFDYMTVVMGWNEDKTEIAVGTALYTVNFDMNGHGDAIDAVSLLSGYKVAEPTKPTADDWFFVGWFTDDACTSQWNFNNAVTSNMTLHALWAQEAIYSFTLPEKMVIVSADHEAVGGKYPVGTVIKFKVSSADYVVDGDVSDGTNTLTPDVDGNYTITMGETDITITATVKKAVEPNKTLSGSESYTANDGDVLTGSTSGTVTIADNAKITLSDVTITGGIVCAGTAEITLVGTNSVTGASQKAGIQVGGSGTTLTIKGNGSLTANGGGDSAGIGLSRAWDVDATGGDIVIEGGTITATGNGMGAGIGTGVCFGDNSNKTATIGNITIKGGTVRAIAGTNNSYPGNGIGKGGAYSYGHAVVGTITIYDGIDMVDASSISESVTYMHVENETETNVTESKADYFTIIENGNRRIIVQKVTPTIADVPDQTYTGSEIKPEPLVIAGSLSLTKGTDYVYYYTNNTNFGTAKVRATFQGTYASLGYVEKEFTILPPPVVVNVTGNGTVTYNDKSAASGETIGVTAEKGTDVTLTLAPESGYAVSIEYGYTRYTNSSEMTINGAKLPINGTTATLTVPNDMKDGTYVNLTVTFVSALAGGADEALAVALTDNTLTDLAGGWYKVDSDITFDHTLNLLGDTHLIIDDGKTMTVNTASNRGIYSDYTLTVSGAGALNVTTTSSGIAVCVGNYVQTGATVTASGYIGIRCTDAFIAFNFDNDFTFSGGQLTATGSGGDGIWADNDITLSCTNATDFIQASSFSSEYGAVKIADGKALTDGTEASNGMNGYSGTLTDEQITAIGGKTLHRAVTTSYVEASGTLHENVIAIPLDDTMTTLAAGWYVVNSDVDYTGTVTLSGDVKLTLSGDVKLILGDGCTMSFGKEGELLNATIMECNNHNLTIYGQSGGTGWLKAYSAQYDGIKNVNYYTQYSGNVLIFDGNGACIYAREFTILGGTLDLKDVGGANGEIVTTENINIRGGKLWAWYTGLKTNGKIILDYTNATDQIRAYSYQPQNGLEIADGKTLVDENGTIWSGTLEYYQIGFNNSTLRPFKTITLADNADNSSTISEWNGGVAEVTLSGRTLYKDGAWNTLCLPFSLSAEQIAANTDFAGATLMTMDVTKKNGFDVEDGTLYLWFKTATEIEAGVPYLVKWDKAADYDNNPSVYDIVSPVFKGVTVSNSTAQTVESKTAGLETVQMVGTYSPVGVTADDKSILFLGDANTLYYSTVDRQIRSYRAYFSVPYINGHAEAKARAFALSFDGEETTGILEVSANYNGVKDDVWYSLDGVRLSGKPTQRGMYINKGKKILVK